MTARRRGTPDFLLLFLTLALVAFGLLMVFSASSMITAYRLDDPFYYTKRQGVAIAVGLAAMLFWMNLPLAKLKRWVIPFFLAVFAALVLVPFIGTEGAYGGRSWFSLGPFNLQPTEFAKLAIVLYLTHLIVKKGEKIRDFRYGLLPCLIITSIFVGLIMLQPDLGSAAILFIGALIVILAGGANAKHVALLAGGGAACGAAALFVYTLYNPDYYEDYRLKRLLTFLDPWQDSTDSGYQIVQSLYAFGNGGWTGTGFGQSVQKLHFLTQAHNDFVFSVIGEELGFIGSSLFILVYILFIWRGIIVSLRCPDPFGSLAGVGIMAMIGLQALINIGGVTNSIPMTGVTLPFISYGGSSVIASLMGLGIVLGISRTAERPAPKNRRQP